MFLSCGSNPRPFRCDSTVLTTVVQLSYSNNRFHCRDKNPTNMYNCNRRLFEAESYIYQISESYTKWKVNEMAQNVLPVLEVATTTQCHHLHDWLQDKNCSKEVIEDLQGIFQLLVRKKGCILLSRNYETKYKMYVNVLKKETFFP